MQRRAVACVATPEPVSASLYASMLTLAMEMDGTPLLFFSQLAWHTRNFEPIRAPFILVMAAGKSSDPLPRGRISAI